MYKHIKNIIVFGIIPAWIIFLISFFPHKLSYWADFWWIFPLALIIAVIVNTVGISGSAIFVPFFILIFPLIASPLTAGQSIMLGLITESFGLSSSALAFWWFGLIDKKIGVRTFLAAAPFVIAGSMISFYLSEKLLRGVVASALVIAIILMVSKKRKRSKEECLRDKVIGRDHKHIFSDNNTLTDKSGKKYKYCRFCGMKKRMLGYSLGGLFQGASGFGIGELGILSMVLTNIPLRVAIGTSHMIVASTAVIASVFHIFQASNMDISIPWNILMMTVPAVLLGGQIAPYISSRLKTNFLEYFVVILFSLIAAALLWISFI